MTEHTSWKTVQSWISRNPNKNKLFPEISLKSDISNIPVEEESKTEWSTSEVSPSTPLSCLLFLTDATYQNLNEQSRLSLLRTECTNLQETAAVQCKGRQFPVRKTAEGLAQVGLEVRGDYSTIGLKALTYLRDCQIVFLDEQKKHITFAPEDIRNWSEEKEIFYIQSDMRGIYQPPLGFTQKNLSKWLSDKEHDGWSVEYPLVDAATSVEDLKKLMTEHNEAIPNKITKDALRKRVGKAQSIRTLAQWSI